jgi:hypothetical protein
MILKEYWLGNWGVKTLSNWPTGEYGSGTPGGPALPIGDEGV